MFDFFRPKVRRSKEEMTGDGATTTTTTTTAPAREPSRGGVSSKPAPGAPPNRAQPFDNKRLAAWEKQREAWTAAGRAGGLMTEARRRDRDRRPVLSADATYDDLLTSSRAFPQPVPLVEMVDFLVEVWDEDGLYD